MHQVEWKAILALWEFDRFCYACEDKPFPYSDPPKDKTDPWYEKYFCDGSLLKVTFWRKPLSGYNRFRNLLYEKYTNKRWRSFDKEYKYSPGVAIQNDDYNDETTQREGLGFSF